MDNIDKIVLERLIHYLSHPQDIASLSAVCKNYRRLILFLNPLFLKNKYIGNEYKEWVVDLKNKKEGKLTFMISGVVRRVENYKDGLLHGKTIWYYSDNLVKAERNYHEGYLHGNSLTYHSNGTLESKLNYVMNKLNGKCTYYKLGGEKIRQLFFVNGLKHGLETIYNLKGKIAKLSPYKNDLLDGEEIIYGDKGDVETIIYKDGLKHGMHTIKKDGMISSCFYKNDKKGGWDKQQIKKYLDVEITHSFYNNNKKDGMYYRWINNSLMETGCFKENELLWKTTLTPAGHPSEYFVIEPDGKTIHMSFFEDGQLESYTEFVKNVIHGEEKRFSLNGEYVFKGSYINGAREGPHVTYDKVGLVELAHYQSNNLHGYYFKFQGDYSEEGHYKYGRRSKWWNKYMKGVLIHRYRYKGGKKNGLSKVYEGGKLVHYIRYIQDQQHKIILPSEIDTYILHRGPIVEKITK